MLLAMVTTTLLLKIADECLSQMGCQSWYTFHRSVPSIDLLLNLNKFAGRLGSPVDYTQIEEFRRWLYSNNEFRMDRE